MDRPLRLALIGMSGAGKTYWTRKLAESGWPAISCDAHIEARLGSRLHAGGHQDINGVAAWMGWPDRPTYAERESEYLAEEIHTLDEILDNLERDANRPLILDTTGSVIYTGNHLLFRLRKQMTVVYLAASDHERALLIERYVTDPKPVLWRGAFQSRPGESSFQTIQRCYPALAEGRRRSYEALAHCTIQISDLQQPGMTAQEFLNLVQAAASP